MRYNSIISVGANCRVAQALRDLHLRHEALPLDWTLNSGQSLLELFTNDFEGFFTRKNCLDVSFTSSSGKICPWIFNQKYQISFIHEKEWNNERLLTYTKRVKALKLSLNQERVLLIRWDMKAPFHNDHNHIKHEQRDKEYFQKTDSLESLYLLKNFCNEQYNGTTDLLILHSDPINDENKQPGIYYHFIDHEEAQKKGKNWDHIAIRKAIKMLGIKILNNPVKPTLFEKIKLWTY